MYALPGNSISEMTYHLLSGTLTLYSLTYCCIGAVSLSVTCHPTQVNVPHLNSRRAGHYLIYPVSNESSFCCCPAVVFLLI